MCARILAIEDNQANLELMKYLLTSFKHTVLEAFDGRSGLALAQSERPDLVVCDVQLPDLNGHEIARRFKSEPALRGLSLVAVTAYAMVGDRERTLAAGFDGYIAKPIEPETFVTQLEQFLPPHLRHVGRETRTLELNPRTVPLPAPTRAAILVVDNVPANLDVLCSTLEPLGYRVLRASSVDEALAVASVHTPDLIISDLHMPDGSGLELLVSVRADPRLAPIPFILSSATSVRSVQLPRFAPNQPCKFLLRPVDPSVLIAIIEESLQKVEDA